MRLPHNTQRLCIMPKSRTRTALLPCALLSMALALTALPGQTNEDSLMCHGEAGLVGERDGAQISISVLPELFAGSVHGDLDCVMCHQDLDGIELPHDEETERVDCGQCHDDVAERQRKVYYFATGLIAPAFGIGSRIVWELL